MATSGGDPTRWKPTSVQGVLSSSLGGTQSVQVRSENERWSSFSSGQRPINSYNTTSSSFLLQQLIQRSQDSVIDLEESDGEGEEEAENAMESEESSVSEIPQLEEEFDGVLREEAVAEALYQLGRSGSGTEQVFLNLTLSGCDLIDISILCGYVHLQKLDLSVNKIGDLSCVSCMPYLLELNASQNKLTTFFNFKPPKNLKKVDFSYNQISTMSDLSAYQDLTKLILDRYTDNKIEEICGLELCNNLTHLSLAQNRITTISGLGTLPIKILCLRHNQIEKITGLEQLRALQIVDLSHNKIVSLQGLEGHDFLEVINLENNQISDLGEIEYIENLPLLRVLNLLKNPIQEQSKYWLFVIFMLLHLTELDQKKINVEEKVVAMNKYNPPPEVVAARDHLTHVVNSVMQPQRIFDSTLPSLDAPYPMLVLAGPQACGKRELAHRLCRQFSTYFRFGPCHTTRPPYFGEGDRVDYQFVSVEVFNKMVNTGKFILTYNYSDHSYGLSRDTIEAIARDGLATCVHMEIEGIRSLKNTYFEPRYILVLPMNKKKYEGHLRRKGLFSRVEIEYAVSRVDHYLTINRKVPGFFDAVINADDLDAAYQQLSQLIREYLGLSEESRASLSSTGGDPSSKKAPSGVPAHLVPSPRRLARLQAGGLTAGRLSGVQVPESQSQQLTREGAAPPRELSPNSPAGAEPPPQPRSAAPSPPQEAQDSSPSQEEGHVQQSDLSSKIATTRPPENGAQTSKMEAGEIGQGPPRAPGPPPVHSPRPDQNEESGEVKVTPTDPLSHESSLEPGPTSRSPHRTQDEETASARLPPRSSHHEAPGEPSDPDGAKMLGPSLGESQQPLQEGTPKAEVRASSPFPELPHPQDPATGKQTQDREDPATLLPRGLQAPSRLPQPRVLAPLQSRRPTPRLPSPSRGEASGPASDQAGTPSPRPPPAQGGDPGKLPLISPPHSKPPPHLSPHVGQGPQHIQEEKGREVKLPLISPPIQEPEPQPAPDLPQEEEAQGVRLPRLPTPLPQNLKEGQAPKAGRPSGKEIAAMQALPPNQEPVARKKNLPIQRETTRGAAHLEKVPPGSHQTALQPEAQNRPTDPAVAAHPNPSPPQNPQGNQRSRAHPPKVPEPPAEPLPGDPRLQEQKRGKVHYSRKKAQANLPPNDLAQKVAVSKTGPSSKRESSGRLSQEKKTTLSNDQAAQGGQLARGTAPRNAEAHAESTSGRSASTEPLRRTEEVHKGGRSQKRETASGPPQLDGPVPNPQPVPETSETGESSDQVDDASRQKTKEKRTPKLRGPPQDRSPAAPQNPVSAEEQGSRQERLRARGSQSTKV